VPVEALEEIFSPRGPGIALVDVLLAFGGMAVGAFSWVVVRVELEPCVCGEPINCKFGYKSSLVRGEASPGLFVCIPVDLARCPGIPTFFFLKVVPVSVCCSFIFEVALFESSDWHCLVVECCCGRWK